MRAKLKQLRNDRPLVEIALTIGITPQMLGAVEKGDRTPSLHLAKKIADFYNVSIDELFFEEIRNNSFPK